MGTWGSGPFENDAAGDFLAEAQGSPSRTLAKVLRHLARAPADTYLEIDDTGAGWAACELVALAFGQGDTASLDGHLLDVVAKLAPKEEHRRLALEVLPRIADPATSELADLWHEGEDGALFDAAIADLRKRLEAASAGPREVPKPKPGDVIALRTGGPLREAGGGQQEALAPAAAPSPELVIVQVVGSSEVAVFEGTFADEAAALAAVKGHPARRVPAAVNKILRRGQVLANVPLRKELRGKKAYADECGAIEEYALSTASGGGVRIVSYEEVREHELFLMHDEDAIRAVALGSRPPARVRSPDAREAALHADHAAAWAARREVTTPGPFGDLVYLEALLGWIADTGLHNAVQSLCMVADGQTGYGRPSEDAERRSYAFAGLVALWRGTWPAEHWPTALAGRLPAPPTAADLAKALRAARTLADRVITRDAELRLIWDGAPDGGAGLRGWVASLKEALGA
ncbi:DUF4259 domain-containing protein [Chondromyces apiculatus]|uniref:DUF4259 domain-containing protein n=1 Tax=Chondromyces apiculatus DSM 436 TaxID=1192034 RepID=A0A017TG25_9BACT|nr:DUF4259 domain-containing protein [Chondromyces apiculatus]EYF08248.1 Hypothetical protein CAP_6009 [Chondromyces apiculatus DSM 436]